MMMHQQSAHTSPGTICCIRHGVPGSPGITIVVKMDNQVIEYKDLAALPKDKAILDIERPDLMMYEPYFSYSPMDHSEISLSKSDWSEPNSLGSSTHASTQMSKNINISTKIPLQHQHFHRPENGTNIYKKLPIYKLDVSAAVPHRKHTENLIIKSSKFPAGQPPDPNQPSKIETEYWPCPPSLAVIETERRNKVAYNTVKGEEGKEEEDDGIDLPQNIWRLRQVQKQKLSKIGDAQIRSIDRGNSLLNMLEQKMLIVTYRNKLPPAVDRTKLEWHQSPEESEDIFNESQWRNTINSPFGSRTC